MLFGDSTHGFNGQGETDFGLSPIPLATTCGQSCAITNPLAMWAMSMILE